MTGFIVRRTLSMIVTFIVVSIVIFLMMHSIPGGPFDGYEMPLPDNIKERLMATLGLDRTMPLSEQLRLAVGQSVGCNARAQR